MSMWMMRRVWTVTEQLRCHEIMELFQRLAEGHAARITVVTPNRRLAQALTAEFDSFQVAKGLTVWEAPDILPFGAFVERLWEDALYSELGDKLPLLLTPQQELLLWEQILEGSDLLILPQAAAQCRDASGLLIPHVLRLGKRRAGVRRKMDARAPGRRPRAHRRCRAPVRDAAQGSRARLLARPAAGPPPARRAEGAAALQRLVRRASLELRACRCRIGFTRTFFPQCGFRKGQQIIALPLPRRRRNRDGAARDARRAPAQEARGDGRSSQADRLHRAMPASAAGPGKSICIGGRNGGKDPFRMGAAFLGAARGGRLPRRALARLGGVPDARQVARSTR